MIKYHHSAFVLPCISRPCIASARRSFRYNTTHRLRFSALLFRSMPLCSGHRPSFRHTTIKAMPAIHHISTHFSTMEVNSCNSAPFRTFPIASANQRLQLISTHFIACNSAHAMTPLSLTNQIRTGPSHKSIKPPFASLSEQHSKLRPILSTFCI